MCAAALAACTSTQPPAATPTAAGTSIAVPTGLTPAPTGLPEVRDDGSTARPQPVSTLRLDDASRKAATDAATKAMTLFARREVPAQRWLDDLAPLLTPPAAQAYAGTDPAKVPPAKVTGRASITPASVSRLARVAVPTDAGVYLVILSRNATDPRWLIERITPPESFGSD